MDHSSAPQTSSPPTINPLESSPKSFLPPAVSPNGSPSPASSTPSRPRKWNKRKRVLVILALVGVLAGAVIGFSFYLARPKGIPHDLLFHKVQWEKLQLTIVERGSLEAAKNYDITCQVKAKSQQSNVASSIKWVIEDGTRVKKGDKLIELDDSGLQDQYLTQLLTVESKEADWIKAEETYKISETQGSTDIQAKESALEVQWINLQKWNEGDYISQLKDIESRMIQAQSDVEMWEERADWSDRMSRPGRQYVTVAQAEADAARSRNARIVLDKARLDREVLDYTDRAQLENLISLVVTAKGALEVARLTAKANMAQSDATRKAARSAYEKEASRLADIAGDIKKCVVYAPQDGMVVYYTDDRNRFAQNPAVIAQGENVKEGQKLMRIPDMSRMVVNTRVHEAMVNKVRADRWEKTGFSDLVTFSLLATDIDPLSRSVRYGAAQDALLGFAESYRNAELRLLEHGQEATIRCNAFPDRLLHGHVKSVATVASQQDFFSSDVKVYQTMVSIDDSMPDLKPGMDAVVTIFTEKQHDPVLAIPLEAILGSVETGKNRTCFVVTPAGIERRQIKVGISNDSLAEIDEGLAEDETVVANPQKLLTEQEKRDPANMSARQAGGQGGPGMGEMQGQGRGKGKGSGGKVRPGSPAGGPPSVDGKPMTPDGQGRSRGGFASPS